MSASPDVGLDPAALGYPDDYFRHLRRVEADNWWHVGVRRISAELLTGHLPPAGAAVLDAGCGTGGYLEWLQGWARPARLAAADISAEAVALARQRLPEAEVAVAPLKDMPFEDHAFDLVVSNDVLQHVPEEDVASSLVELRRLLRTGGTLLLRTGGDLRARRERADWRVYDKPTLRRELEGAGFRCSRLTYVNVIPSLWAAARGHRPHAPTREQHGLPAPSSGAVARLGGALLGAEAALLRRSWASLPYGHTLFALARPRAS